MVDYNDGKWPGWDGGECPVHPETVVEYVWNGSAGLVSQTEKAGSGLGWMSTGKYHMIAFRVIKEYREPREPREWHVAVNSKGQVMGCNEWHPTSSLAEELGKYTLVKVREVI